MRHLACLCAVLLHTPSFAAVIVVTTLSDDLTNNGNCTLREAISAANADATQDGCRAGSGADLVVLPAGAYVLSLAGNNEGANATGDLDISSDVTVLAPSGAAFTSISAAGLDRVFEVGPGARLSLRGVTLRDGVASNFGRGGAVLCYGGALLEIASSSFEDNQALVAPAAGGAIYGDSCLIDIQGSTFLSNSASQGGAISTERGTLFVRSSTFVGNQATGGHGHAVQSINGTATGFSVYTLLEHVTISGNASGGSAIRNTAGAGGSPRLELRNNIIETPSGSAGITNNGGTITSLGGNVLTSTSAITLAPSDLVVTSASLAGLAENGGSTRTRLPLPTSPVVDHVAIGACSGEDQRGLPRPQGSGCEPGAVELYEFPALFEVTSLAAGAGGCAAGGITVRMGRDDGRGGGMPGNGSLEPGEVTATSNVCNGTNGTNGTDGANGTNGASCSVAQGTGSATVTCTDGTTATVQNGADGADGAPGSNGQSGAAGADGSACSVTQTSTGATVSCTDGAQANLTHGGACAVAQTSAGVTISCPDESSATVSNGTAGPMGAPGADGVAGASCSVSENADGTATLTCPDGSSTTFSSGAPVQGGGCSAAGATSATWALWLLCVAGALHRRRSRRVRVQVRRRT